MPHPVLIQVLLPGLLLALPLHLVGLAALLGLGTLIMTRLGRRDDIVTTGIITAVAMVVAAMGPRQDAPEDMFFASLQKRSLQAER